MPGVVLFHTAAGPRDLYLLYRGAQLASQGYVVLNADLYGDPDGQVSCPLKHAATHAFELQFVFRESQGVLTI